MITQITDDLTAGLETLFNDNAQTFNGGTGTAGNLDQTHQGAAVCQKIIDDQHMILRGQKPLGNDDLILVLVGKGFHFRHQHLTVDVDGLGLLRENHGNTKFLGNKSGNADTGSLNGQHLVDGLAFKTALEFPADFLHQRDIHLMVQKTVDLQNITGLYSTVFHDSFFQKIHNSYTSCRLRIL